MVMVVSSEEGETGEGTKLEKQNPNWRCCDSVREKDREGVNGQVIVVHWSQCGVVSMEVCCIGNDAEGFQMAACNEGARVSVRCRKTRAGHRRC